MRLIGVYSYYDLIVKAAVRDAGGAKIRTGGIASKAKVTPPPLVNQAAGSTRTWPSWFAPPRRRPRATHPA